MLVVAEVVAIVAGNALVAASFWAPAPADGARVAGAGVVLALLGVGLVVADLLRGDRA